MSRSRLFTILSLIFIGTISRFLPHPPNFTAINATALFGAYALGHMGFAFCIIFASMFLSDLVLGLHSQIFFVYLSLGMTLLLSRLPLRLPVTLAASSLLFFVIANFGVWLFDGLYPHTLKGLGFCYIAALPFLTNQLIGDLFYGFALFGCFFLTKKYIPSLQEV